MSSFSVLKCIYIIYVMDAAFDTVLCVLVSVPQQQQQPGHARIDDNDNNHHDDTCDSVVDVRCFIHQSSPLDI